MGTTERAARSRDCPAERARYARRGHFVTCIPVSVGWTARVLPLVGSKISPEHREDQPKGYTSHEVTALRAGARPAGHYLLGALVD